MAISIISDDTQYGSAIYRTNRFDNDCNHSLNWYNDGSPSCSELGALLARCHSTSCYNCDRTMLPCISALARCHSTSCYNLHHVCESDPSALARCHSTSCYNQHVDVESSVDALARCHSTSCYNIHPRKSPLSRGLAVFKLGKGSIVGHSRVTSARFSEKGEEKEITCRVRRAPRRIYSASDPSTTGPLAQTLLVAIPQAVTKT